MLVHICCSVDSHYFLTRLRADYPDERLVGYFYNPNIFPKSEYDLRLLDVKRSCNRLEIELTLGEYDDDSWANSVQGLENEPEKGKRCELCFDIRFEKSARKAKELGLSTFTSTLLQSPLKDKNQLRTSLAKIASNYDVSFVFVDYLSNGGKEAQSRASHEEGLYRQNYCGCVWGVINQRTNSQKVAIECFSPLDRIAMPSSSEKRVATYNQLVATKTVQKTTKSKIINYRLLSATLGTDDTILPSFVLSYSTSGKKSWSSGVEFEQNGILHLKKESTKIISLARFCEICNKSWKGIEDLLQNPPSFEEQVMARFALSGAVYDISPIFVVENISNIQLFKIELNAILFDSIDEEKST